MTLWSQWLFAESFNEDFPWFAISLCHYAVIREICKCDQHIKIPDEWMTKSKSIYPRKKKSLRQSRGICLFSSGYLPCHLSFVVVKKNRRGGEEKENPPRGNIFSRYATKLWRMTRSRSDQQRAYSNPNQLIIIVFNGFGTEFRKRSRQFYCFDFSFGRSQRHLLLRHRVNPSILRFGPFWFTELLSIGLSDYIGKCDSLWPLQGDLLQRYSQSFCCTLLLSTHTMRCPMGTESRLLYKINR